MTTVQDERILSSQIERQKLLDNIREHRQTRELQLELRQELEDLYAKTTATKTQARALKGKLDETIFEFRSVQISKASSRSAGRFFPVGVETFETL